jgi:hypothetical protein
MKKADHVRAEMAKGQVRDHECHARNCSRQVPPALFMCKKHWAMVPDSMQKAIWHHYQPGQEKGEARPTREYFEATRVAIAHVAQLEEKQAGADDRQLELFAKR